MREGFEPSVQFPVRQFSKLILSASQAPHHIYLPNGLYYNTPFLGTANIAIRLSRQKEFVVKVENVVEVVNVEHVGGYHAINFYNHYNPYNL